MAKFQKKVSESVINTAPAEFPAANGLQEGTAEVAPPMPMTPELPRGWFQRAWHYLFVAHLLNDQDEIIAFSHTPGSVTVRLSSGHEYCIDKARL